MSRTPAGGVPRYLPIPLRNPWPFGGAIAVIALLLSALAASPFVPLDRTWIDFLLRQRQRLGLSPQPDERLFLIGLTTDDFMAASSTEAEYETYAGAIDMLTELDAKVVMFDLMLSRGSAADARTILESIRRSGRVVLAEAVEHGRLRRSFPFAPAEVPAGRINAMTDPDGLYRRYHYGWAGRECKPSLALAGYLKYFDAPASLRCSAGELFWKELGPDQSSIVERRLSSSPVLLNYRAPATVGRDRSGFKYLPLAELRKRYAEWKAAGANPLSRPKGLPDPGNIVLVGSVAIGTGDAGPTPFGNFEPLVVTHATALGDLLQGRMLREAARPVNTAIAVLGVLLIGLAGSRWRSITPFLAASAAAILFVLAASAGLLFRLSTVIAAVTPAGFMLAAVLIESGRKAVLESFERAKTKATLGRYFSPKVLEEVLRNPDATKPREAELTVLLTDVRNFTTITEQYGAKRIFDLLNEMFEIETRAVLDLDGSMEHFVGDQFLAYWGAPNPQADAPDRALLAARRIIDGLAGLQQNLEPGVRELFGYGVAIHTGKALCGNKGSLARLDYGILGDIVNAAARVESLTKYYGVRQIVTREVIERKTVQLPTRFLDRIRVKGRAEPMELYEVLQDSSEERLAAARCYEDAWRLYEQGCFQEATDLFEAQPGGDMPSRVLAGRCRAFAGHAPAAWNGVYVFTEK